MHFHLDEQGPIPLLQLEADWGWATIACQGAQVWQVHLGGRQRLYTSPTTAWELGQPLRGGIPLCWPWLGRHPQQPAWGMHGPLRTQLFALQECRLRSNCIKAHLRCHLSAKLPGLTGPCQADVHCALRPDSLTVALSIRNLGTQAQPSAGAMHTYLACQAESFALDGLDGCTWHGPDESDETGVLAGTLSHCCGNTRTLYDQDNRPYPITCEDGQQHMRLQRFGSRSVVVWNPGKEHGIADLEADSWRSFVCVETANSGHDARSIPPGGVGCMASCWCWSPS